MNDRRWIRRGRRLLAALVATGTAVGMCACGGTSTTATTSAGSGSATAGPARTVMSCTEKLTFTSAPRRVILMSETDVSVMAKLGLLDSVVGRAGPLKTENYDSATAARLKAIPVVSSTKLATGGARISTETIVASRADLVIGYDSGVDRDALRRSGIKLYSPDAWCESPSAARATFGLARDEVTKVAQIFGVQDRARKVNAQLAADETALTRSATRRGSAAAFWIDPGASTFYTYGSSSMVQPIFEANGLTNVYGDQSKRVFDATMEDVLKRDPEWIVLLAQTGAVDKVTPAFLGFKGASSLRAVKAGHVVAMPFALTDPPTPLSLEGAKELHRLLEQKS